MENDRICIVEVVYAAKDSQSLLSLEVSEHCTVEQAIQQSGLLKTFPEIDLQKNEVGIFSQKVTLNHPLQNGDRIEIYRPLLIDPKESRRKKAS